MKKLIKLSDVSSSFIAEVLSVADDFETFKSRYGVLPDLLRGKTLGMIFDAPSLRTRSAFEIAMTDLGGVALLYKGEEARVGMTIEDREHTADFSNVIGAFNDVVLCRIYDHRAQSELASHLPTHFINGMCDLHHPTQALCDLLTIKRRFSSLDGLRIAFLGDATNVAFSLAEGMACYESEFVLSSPPEFMPVVERFRKLRNVVYEPDPNKAVEGAHVILTDSWAPMNKKHELDARSAILAPYRVTESLFARARSDCIFMHNLPASREHEVAPGVIDGSRSVVYAEAVARLHIARALLYLILRQTN